MRKHEKCAKSSPGHVETSLYSLNNQLCAPNKVKSPRNWTEHSVILYVQNQHLQYLSWFQLATRHVSNGSLSLRSMEWKSMDSITGISFCLRNVCCYQTHCSRNYFLGNRTSLHCAYNTVQLLQQKTQFHCSWVVAPNNPVHNCIDYKIPRFMLRHEHMLWVNKIESEYIG